MLEARTNVMNLY